MRQTRTGWAIAGRCGLYVGWNFRRLDVIAEHVRDVRRSSEPETSGFVRGDCLSPEQAKIWSRCKRAGDKAVKIKISYEYKS